MTTAKNGPRIAEVVALTAEVHALMVGSRQITLSVYRQLDTVSPEAIKPFGRVRDGRDPEADKHERAEWWGLGDLPTSHVGRFESEEMKGYASFECRERDHYLYVIGRDRDTGALVRALTWRRMHTATLHDKYKSYRRDAPRAFWWEYPDDSASRWKEWDALDLIVLAGLR